MSIPAPSPGEIVAARGTPTNAAHIRLGYDAFNAGQYEQAMMYFQLTEADPLQILSLFPDVLPSGLVGAANGGSGGSASEDSSASTHGVSAFPSSSPFARLRMPPHPVPVLHVQGEERLFRALSALIPYLAQIQNRLRLSLEPIFASPTVATHTSAGRGRRGGGEEDAALGAIPTKRKPHTSAAASSSTPVSVPPSAESNLALAILVDTALLKAYLLCDIPLLPFLSSPYNLCDVSECAHILRAYEKSTELVAFYRYRARHQQALELMQNLAQVDAPKGTAGKTPAPLLAGSSSAHSSAAISVAGLSGSEATIRYLQELAINIHQPCYPMQGNAGGDDAGSADDELLKAVAAASSASSTGTGAGGLPSQFSPASSLDSAPDTVIALILHYSKAPLLANVDDGLRIFTFCHTMNMRPVEGKAGGNKGSSSNSSNAGATPSSLIHSYAHHSQHCIPAHIVLEHLKKFADREACVAYLESLINHVGETNSLFHNELIFLYLESIQRLLRAQEQREATLKSMAAANSVAGVVSPSVRDEPERLESVGDLPVRARGPSTVGGRQRGASEVLGAGALAPPGAIASTPASTATLSATNGVSTRDATRLLILRRKLLHFLRTSVSYAAEKMLSRFPRHMLLEERAILLSRINQHVQALNIYAHRLHDPLQAEAYAEEYYLLAQQASAAANASSTAGSAALLSGGIGANAASSNVNSLSGASISGSAASEGRDMYLHLLQVYLRPPPLEPAERSSVLAAQQAHGSKGANGSHAPVDGQAPSAPAPMLDAALSLLSKYFDRIPSVGALESLPLETPLQALWPYFEKLLCHSVHTARAEQISKQLLKAEYYAMKEQYLLASRGRVLCDTNTVCSRCNKKIGASAFARYPNGQIVHYVCHQLSVQAGQNAAVQPKGDL